MQAEPSANLPEWLQLSAPRVPWIPHGWHLLKRMHRSVDNRLFILDNMFTTLGQRSIGSFQNMSVHNEVKDIVAV